MNLTDIKQFIKENNIHTIEAGFADIHGILRGKTIPSRHFIKYAEEGIDFAVAPFAWDVQCGVYDDIEKGNFSDGFPDITAKPILSSIRKVPWKEGTAFVLYEAQQCDGNVLEVSPREILKNVLKKANELGFRPLIGTELEFYLLDENKKPLFEGTQCYSLFKGAELEYVIGEMRTGLEAFGIELEAFHIEYGPAQIEVIPEYGDALKIADQSILIKNAIKEIARKHGFTATFMAKPWAGESGCGFHIHQSLWDLDLKTNFFRSDEKITNNYLAGLLKYAKDLVVLGAPTINDYKRFKENSFAPTKIRTDHDNRTVAVRSLLGIGDSSRFEYRLGSAAANPYLAIAASLISGIDGIENNLSETQPVNNRTKLMEEELVPKNLEEALRRLEFSDIAKKYFGEKFINLFLTLGKHEVELYNATITDWEWDRYMEII